jgi:hypothetical protein
MGYMVHDFGPGMTIDELIDMRAVDIAALNLPSETLYAVVKQAASIMIDAELTMYVLSELWEDGHSVWRDFMTEETVVVTPTGQIRTSKD